MLNKWANIKWYNTAVCKGVLPGIQCVRHTYRKGWVYFRDSKKHLGIIADNQQYMSAWCDAASKRDNTVPGRINRRISVGNQSAGKQKGIILSLDLALVLHVWKFMLKYGIHDSSGMLINWRGFRENQWESLQDWKASLWMPGQPYS